MAKSNEAFWWSLFSAGGVLAALFIAGFVAATGFLLPTDEAAAAADRYHQIHGTVGWWPVRIVMFTVIFLSLFHCAHRLRHTLMDVGFRHLARILMVVCYGGALAGTIVAGYLLVTFA